MLIYSLTCSCCAPFFKIFLGSFRSVQRYVCMPIGEGLGVISEIWSKNGKIGFCISFDVFSFFFVGWILSCSSVHDYLISNVIGGSMISANKYLMLNRYIQMHELEQTFNGSAVDFWRHQIAYAYSAPSTSRWLDSLWLRFSVSAVLNPFQGQFISPYSL